MKDRFITDQQKETLKKAIKDKNTDFIIRLRKAIIDSIMEKGQDKNSATMYFAHYFSNLESEIKKEKQKTYL